MSLSIPADFQASLPSSRSDTPPGQRQSSQRHLRSQSIVSESTSHLSTAEARIRRTQDSNGPSQVRRAPPHASLSRPAHTSKSTELYEQQVVSPNKGDSLSSSPAARSDGSVSPRPDPHVAHPENMTDRNNGLNSTRSSLDLDALSNHSQETLASERPPLPPQSDRTWRRSDRQPFLAGNGAARPAEVVTLLMGYAQITANCTLESALIDQSSFDEVKGKGFLGGQAGGGVVGVQKSAPKSSLFGAFGLTSITETLGEIMNGSEISSVREMKAATNARTVPLLSTPQSLLFINNKLAPGDEVSYRFTFRLPKGLPSSHRGRAIKINYRLTIGVQLDSGYGKPQTVRQVHVPVRVFSAVSPDGEIYGHDLMQPHVILQDAAQVTMASDAQNLLDRYPARETTNRDTTHEFLGYVNTLLDKNRRRQSSSGTIDAMSKAFAQNDGNDAHRAIERAILLSNQSGPTQNTSNRFEVTREGEAVAIILLDRAVHKLGETIVATINFAESTLICSSVRATLETTEKVTPSLAIRSEASISRATQRIHATYNENTLFAKRIVFSPTIPETATPTFVTTGVSLDWQLSFEFAVVRNDDELATEEDYRPAMLEDITNDERGVVQAAIEGMTCETLEVKIPLTIYGEVVRRGSEESDVVGLAI